MSRRRVVVGAVIFAAVLAAAAAILDRPVLALILAGTAAMMAAVDYLHRLTTAATAAVVTLTRELKCEREASVRRHDKLAEQVAALAGELERDQSELRLFVQKLSYNIVQQVEALIQLYQRVSPASAMPPSSHWAMEPTALLQMLTLVEEMKPSLVVECGSGTSSVWFGYALRAAGQGRVVALEHHADFAKRTREQLGTHGLDDIVEVRDAPLEPLDLGAETFQWYSRSAVTDLKDIDILVVDGPPQSTGPLARYPALPVLAAQLAEKAVIVVDDVDRGDERRQCKRWLEEIDGLRDPRRRAGHTGFLSYARSEEPDDVAADHSSTWEQ